MSNPIVGTNAYLSCKIIQQFSPDAFLVTLDGTNAIPVSKSLILSKEDIQFPKKEIITVDAVETEKNHFKQRG